MRLFPRGHENEAGALQTLDERSRRQYPTWYAWSETASECMHQIVELGLPYAPDGRVYLEDGGRRILRVFPDLSSEDIQAISGLRAELDKLIGGLHGYDECIIHLRP